MGLRAVLFPWAEVRRLDRYVEWQGGVIAAVRDDVDRWRGRALVAEALVAERDRAIAELEARLSVASRNDRRGPDGRFVGGGS